MPRTVLAKTVILQAVLHVNGTRPQVDDDSQI